MPKDLNPNLLKEFRREAKKADMRLQRLEQRAVDNPAKYGEILQYAYKRAKKDIYDFTPENVKKPRIRFNSLYGVENNRQLESKLSAVKRFNESKSSTISGVRQVYEKRAAAINKTFKKEKLNIDARTLAKIFDSGLWDKMKAANFTSDTIFKTVAFIQRNKKRLAGQLERNDKIHLTEKQVKFAQGAPTPNIEAFNKVLNSNKKAITDLIAGQWMDADEYENPFF